MCSYLLYGVQKSVCGVGSVADLQKKCDENATKDRGEETKCACTDDQNYIGDACD